jgi:DNA-binding transcriptional LysR family regulator
MTLSSTLVAKAVERFHHQYPRVRFDIRALPTLLAHNAVDTHQVDMGIVDSPQLGADLNVVELCRSDTGCVMRADHPLAKKKSLGPVDIAPYTLISYSNETFAGWQLRSALHDAQTGGQVLFTVNHSHTAYTLVQAGVGIGVVDTFPMFTGAFPELVIRPFHPLIQTNPHVAFSRTHAVPHIAYKFLEILRATTNDLIDASAGMLKPPEPADKAGAVSETVASSGMRPNWK